MDNIDNLIQVLSGVSLVVSLLMLLVVISNIFLFRKAGKPGWAAIVPIYNNLVFYDIICGNKWFGFLPFISIIPVVGTLAFAVISIASIIYLSKAFGKGVGFAMGLLFLPLIFYPMLAFGRAEYEGYVPFFGKDVSLQETYYEGE